MPRFSVIVPAYKVQAYLPACLESVLSQSYEDLELIVVDDRSPDACGEIADEFAARDPRVRAVHLARNKGLGRARNAGISQAMGDYLVFLDGDDTLAPHALRAIADRLKETGEPDVLLHDHALAPWSGGTVRSAFTGQLTEQGPAPSSWRTARGCCGYRRRPGTWRTAGSSSKAGASPSRPATTRTRPGPTRS